MNKERNIKIAKTLLEGMGARLDLDEIATPFAEDLEFEI